MPQLLALALLGAGVAAGYRWVAGRIDEARAAAEAAEAAIRRSGKSADDEPRDLGSLEWDASNGVYRPRS